MALSRVVSEIFKIKKNNKKLTKNEKPLSRVSLLCFFFTLRVPLQNGTTQQYGYPYFTVSAALKYGKLLLSPQSFEPVRLQNKARCFVWQVSDIKICTNLLTLSLCRTFDGPLPAAMLALSWLPSRGPL